MPVRLGNQNGNPLPFNEILSFGSESIFQKKGGRVTKRLVMLALCLAVASPLFAQKKEEERLSSWRSRWFLRRCH